MIARHRRRLLPAIAALTLVGSAGDDPRPARITAAAAASGFAGEILVGEGDRIVIDRSFGLTVPRPAGAAAPDGGFAPGAAWPWASVTKQVVATLVMQQVADGRIALDVPAGRYLPLLAGKVAGPTVRQLLQHRAGLRNPDDTPVGPNGFPAYYTARYPTLGWCLGGRKAAGGKWRYNNCDYVVLGALLQQVTGQTVPALYAERIARPLGLHAQFVAPDDLLRLDWPGGGGVTADERPVFARFGAAGGLAGTARDLVTFDQALLHGRLLPAAARAEMWRGDPGLGFEALGQWSFDAKLKGCPTPVKIIERRGGIGRFQARNILLPDQDMSIVIFTNRGDFDFGEVWQGKGFSYDLLSAAACP
ncbi:serine hydrolase domain-containing protein [uncultured Sphingomonas sp.]|uniref:serine hydrolase domain-containing protein n=1 Tax=uncultured Sphingomonas sp. TaxID=158754 RepID=UPI0035CA96DA